MNSILWYTLLMEYLTDEVESWPTTPVNISIKHTSPEVDTLAQMTLCLSQIVQLCDGHGWSALFTLPLSPVFCSWSMWSQCWSWAHIHRGRRCSHGLIYFSWTVFPHQQTSCLGTHCLGSLTICFLLFHAFFILQNILAAQVFGWMFLLICWLCISSNS